MLSSIIFAMGIGRIILGFVPFVAAKPSAKLLGFPEKHDNPTTRLMARWFGVRDIGLGVLVFWSLRHPETLPFVLLFNAAADFGDLFAISIPLVRRQGIDRAALVSSAFALPAAIAWLCIFALHGGMQS